jgi:hypothetical protein
VLAEAFPQRAAEVTVLAFSATSREGVESADRTIEKWLG